MDKQFTLQEYQEALVHGYKKPDPNDYTDKGYYIKYAHTLPPLQAYMIRPPNYEKFSTEKDTDHRKVYYGWNNLSEFESNQIETIKDHMKEVMKLEPPPRFDDREWLKFLQACKHDIKATGNKLAVHWAWVASLSPEPMLTPLSLKCLQAGCIYIFGRDKFLRPTWVLDGGALSRCAAEDSNVVTIENITEILTFLVRFIRENMFLRGHCD